MVIFFEKFNSIQAWNLLFSDVDLKASGKQHIQTKSFQSFS